MPQSKPASPAAVPQQSEKALTRYEYKQYHMGVDVRIVAYAPDLATAESACSAAFARFAELDSIMSDYRVNSELTLLCNRAGGPPVKVSPDLFTVLARAQEVAKRSGGAFDVTCGPLIRLWRAARKSHILPAEAEIAHARAVSGWRKLKLDPKKRTAELTVAGMKLDLGGIGKGYANDCAQAALRKNGVTRALVEAGGDIVVSDPPPGERGWKVSVANAATAPAVTKVSKLNGKDTKDEPAPVLEFANAAISTSGDIFQSVEIGGKRYSHIIDPRTGWALADRIQVTVVAKDGLTSDPLSKVVSVLGPTGQKMAERYPDVRRVWVRHLGRFE